MKKVWKYALGVLIVGILALLYFRSCSGNNSLGDNFWITARLQGNSPTSTTLVITTDSALWVADSTLEVGVCWIAKGEPTVSDSLRRTTYKGPHIIINFGSSLTAGSKYNVRAFLKGKPGVAYSEMFTILAPRPREAVVIDALRENKQIEKNELPHSLLSVGPVSQNEIEYKVTFDFSGVTDVVEKGCVYSENSAPTLAYKRQIAEKNASEMTGVIGNLMPNKSYYLRPYIITQNDTLYGAIKKITTAKISVPLVDAPEIIKLVGQRAVILVDVKKDGGAPVSERGICWGKEPNPSVDDSHVIDSLSIGIGKSKAKISGLEYNSQYYLRSYASNGVGVAYGPVIKLFTPVGDIGDFYAGGFIFYLDESGRHGSVCASTDQAAREHWLGAIMICDQLVLNGYSDWTLPTRDDLDLMYANLYLNNIGNLSNFYWSSTENDYNDAWYWRMNYGSPYYNFKGNVLSVRAVRRF